MHVMYLFMTVQNKSYIKENIFICVKARASAGGCIWERGKTSMVSTLVVSSKGMYLRVWMLFTSVFTCICYRIYIHKINVTYHEHASWVNKVYINPKFLDFKCLEI